MVHVTFINISRICNVELSADWASVIVNVILGIITLFALLTSVRSSREASKMAQQTLSEARENRKDDVMPVLQFKFAQTISYDEKINEEIINIGSGPIFEVKVISHKAIEVNSRTDDGKLFFTVAVPLAILEADNETYIVFGFEDMYGRKFKQKQKIYRHGNHIIFNALLEAPIKIGSEKQ